MSNYISVSEEASKRLMQMIIFEKVYLPGQRIPNEQELSKMLDASRTSVREAVKMLIARDILEIKRGVGTFVTENPYKNADDILVVCSDENKKCALDALRLRFALEPEMAKRAALRATEKEKAEILKTEEQCRKLIQENRDYTYADQCFHKAVAAASHNRVYERLLPILHTSITIILKSENFVKTTEKSANNAFMYHKILADAVISGDEKGAELAAKTHIYNAIKFLSEYD